VVLLLLLLVPKEMTLEETQRELRAVMGHWTADPCFHPHSVDQLPGYPRRKHLGHLNQKSPAHMLAECAGSIHRMVHPIQS